jgi:V8-like Glu-specific endopeptidase
MSVAPLRFAGHTDAPSPLTEVMARRFVAGTGQQPDALRTLADRRTVLVESPQSGQPSLDISAVPDSGGRMWQATIVGEGQRLGVLPGRTAERHPPEAYLADIDTGISAAGHRPDWADLTFAPQQAPAREIPSMRRLNGHPFEPMDVFGNDDRAVFRDAAYPWGLIGRVFTPQGTGTGVLVGPRLVATAGHMIPWNQAGWWMRFVPAYYDGASLHGAGVESYVSDTRGFDSAGEVAGYDWAVLRLYEPLGASLGWFGYNGYSRDWDNQPFWSIAGYPGAVAGGARPSYQNSVSVFDVDSDSNGGEELESQTADVTGGNSGGPMFAWWGADPRVIGVVSGSESDFIFPASSERANVMAGGPGLSNLIAWARTNWP